MSIKSANTHQGSFKAQRIRSSGAYYLSDLLRLLIPRMYLGKTCTTCLRDHKPNCVSEMCVNCSQIIPVYYPSGKYKLSIRSFSDNGYTIIFVHDILCLSKRCLVRDTKTCTECCSSKFDNNFLP